MGSNRVLRGGSWNYNAFYCRAAYRGSGYPSPPPRFSHFGFRPARSSVPPVTA